MAFGLYRDHPQALKLNNFKQTKILTSFYFEWMWTSEAPIQPDYTNDSSIDSPLWIDLGKTKEKYSKKIFGFYRGLFCFCVGWGFLLVVADWSVEKYSLKRVSSKNVQSSDFLLDYDSPNSTGPSFLRFITKVDFQIFGLTQIWPWAITNHQRRGKIINLKLDRLLSNTVRFWLLSRIMIRKLNSYYLMNEIFVQDSTN